MASSPRFTAQAVSTGEVRGDDTNVFQIIQSHQGRAARLPPVEEIRTVLDRSVRGVLSTLSQKHDGYPSGSMVDFACDADGSPILAVSSLAVHSKAAFAFYLCKAQEIPEETGLDIKGEQGNNPTLYGMDSSSGKLSSQNRPWRLDLSANAKCSLLVARDPEDRTDLVITLHGNAVPVSENDRAAVRSTYLATLPNAFWVDFGDFQFMRIEPKVVRYVSGVATALLGSGEFSNEEYKVAKVDPIAQFSKPVTSHMNKDHADDTKAIVQHSTSIPVDFAHMLDLDSLGFNVKAGYQGSTFKLRIPFPRRAEDRKDVKTLIVEMLCAARPQDN
ncbi:hypothetical protein L484_014756 [Morus notabilis]|uniref:DUF2470 domain-containing protein n=1 Tax=Morus notabilis TaxID=981085 RepID=W9QLY3_9ROSA|nr:hypothetical protein L484_014756 [Morus notabilis]